MWVLTIDGRAIHTTGEHPFFAENHGWKPLAELSVGDRLLGESGDWRTIEALEDTGRYETVYNLRVSQFHTYFVGEAEWGWSVWAHNDYDGFRKALGDAPDTPELRALYEWALKNPRQWTQFRSELEGMGIGKEQLSAIKKAWSVIQNDVKPVASPSSPAAAHALSADVVHVSPDDLTPTHGLPDILRGAGKKKYQKLKADIAEIGMQSPVAYVEHNGVKYVVDGHHRRRAAQELLSSALKSTQRNPYDVGLRR